MLREKETKDLLSQIEKIQSKYEIKMTKVIMDAIRKSENFTSSEKLLDIWNKAEKEITDLFYEMLEEIYSTILAFIKKVYPHASSSEKLDIKDLIWNEDGKTIEERFNTLCSFGYQALLDKVDISLKESLTFMLVRILDTESITVFNKTLKKKVAKQYPIAQVINTGCCEEICDYWGKKFIPTDELEWPPYHPSCRCVVILFTADEVEN